MELCAHGVINSQTWEFALIEEKGELRKELGAVREMRGREEKWQAEETDLSEKNENDRGKDGTKRKEG
jgi:hypothetical protein